MAKGPEAYVKDDIRTVLKERNIYWFCPVQNGMGQPGLDFYCCHKGFFLAIEAKAEGKVPTPRQENTMRDIRESGGLTIVITGRGNIAPLVALLYRMDLAYDIANPNT